MISLKDIVVTFNPSTPLEKRALRGLSLDIPEGEFVTVIGSNGAGKSTALGVLAGEVPATSGSVEIDGRDITRLPVQDRAGDVARVFQDPNVGVCGTLSIEENLALALMRGSPRGFARALTDELREQFRERLKILGMGLEDRLGDRIGLLSGGQRQALSLLMATFASSRILLLDEHTAALDPKMAAFVIGLTRDVIKEFDLTALMVTHSMGDALSCGTRTVMLHGGRIAIDIQGADRDGMTPADFVALFSRTQGDTITDDSLLLA